MSDSLKMLKSLKGADSYSKNPIIDSLIKQKLKSEMKLVKDNFNHFMVKEENRPTKTNTLRKRTLSLQDLAGITPDKIKHSLNYNPTATESAREFVRERQSVSPLMDSQQLEDLNQARTNNHEFLVKRSHPPI